MREYILWYRKKDTGKVEMEYCIRFLGRGTRMKKGVSLLGVLTAILLAAGKSYILPALKLTEIDSVYVIANLNWLVFEFLACH